MSAIITRKFEQWCAERTAANLPARADTFIFAFVPGLDPDGEMDRDEALPPAGQIMHRAPVAQHGLINTDAVAYSVVLDTTVGDFDYNWIGLLDAASGTLCMIVHTRTQKKIATSGQSQGNTLTRTLVMEFDGAAAASQITVTAATWQIDFSGRIFGQDDQLRLANREVYGDGAFFDDGFLVVRNGDTYTATAGRGYVGGIRATLAANIAVSIPAKPTTVWADVSWQGATTSRWSSRVALTAADNLADYTDAQGFPHYVTQLARINVDGSVTDLRRVGAIDDRYLKKSGDTMAGPLTLKSTITADYYGTTQDLYPIGSGGFAHQFDAVAPFYQPVFNWESGPGGHYVPLIKGKGNRKGKGWPTTISYGYLLPGVDEHAHPVIHAIGDGGVECIWEFNTQTGGINSKAGQFAVLTDTLIAPVPWAGSTPPAGYVAMVGQSFDTTAYPRTAQVFPNGVIPDMRGQTIKGMPDGRGPLTFEADGNKYHGHGLEIDGADLGTKQTTANGAYQLKLRSYRSNTSLDGGESSRHTIDQDRGFTDFGLIERIPDHVHDVPIGWHGHTGRVNPDGNPETTVKNIAFNYIVRLA